MQVVVDGIIYQLQASGGVSRIFTEILPRMCDQDDSLRIALLTEGKLKQSLPNSHPNILHQTIPQIERYLRPRRMWRYVAPKVGGIVRKLCIGRGRGKIWHSTYYTIPENWSGSSVATVVDMTYERFTNLFSKPRDESFRARKRRCVLEADAVICISEATCRDVQRFYGLDSSSIYVVPLACSDVFRQLGQSGEGLKRPIREPFLLYVGNRKNYKNVNTLFQAYSAWPGRKEISLVIVGEIWSDDEECQLAELGIQAYVHLFTDVSDDELCRLYNQAVAFVYPSFYEGFGIPLLEAMACGCPIISSRIPSTIEVAEDCPIYFDPDEPDELRNAFDVVLSEGRNSERVRTGFKRVNQYSWDKTAVQTLEVYRAIS